VPIAVDVAALAETNAPDGQDLIGDGHGQWGGHTRRRASKTLRWISRVGHEADAR
jgi:hypothetical protein